MLTITEEFEHRALKTKGKTKEDNAAFHAGDSKKDKKGGNKGVLARESRTGGRLVSPAKPGENFFWTSN